MTFELQPGDWIPPAEVPEGKRLAVIDAFVNAGAVNNLDYDERTFDRKSIVAIFYDGRKGGLLNGSFACCHEEFKRRVTLDQILGKQNQPEDRDWETATMDLRSNVRSS